MPWTVAGIGALSFLAGLAVAAGRFTLAGILVASATAAALVLRWYVITTIRQAFEEGAGYGTSVRRRVRELPEAHLVPEVTRLRWLNGTRGDKKQRGEPDGEST